ncbi:MAG TPA: DUF1634 domain-containing protein [Gemmataceae bacterium]|jgi:uncharacterized membrane protein|nr:DUF1634 domain-containing protein [Gemmataceae bacterium]
MAAWTDEQVEQVVGNLLRVGVIVSALVVLAGGGLFLARYGEDPVKDRHEFREEDEKFRKPGLIVRSAATGSSRGLIQLGLLLLIATPVARVVFSAFAFLRQRDHTYVVITLIVLAVLLYSFFSGHVG